MATGLVVAFSMLVVGFALYVLRKEEFHFEPWLLAASGAALGTSMLWCHHLWKGKTFGGVDYPELFHELGMGFIVAAVVFCSVELTLRISETRSTKKLLDGFGDQIAIKEHLLQLLNALDRKQEENEHRYEEGMKAFASLSKRNLSHPGIDNWKSVHLDSYGIFLMKQGLYAKAEAQFKSVLPIDRDLAKKFDKDYTFRNYVGITLDRLIRAQGAQAKYEEATANLKQLIDERKAIAEKFEEKDESSDADRALRSAKELQGVIELALKMMLKPEQVQNIVIGDAAVEPELEWDKKLRWDGRPSKTYRVKLTKGKRYRIELTTLGKLDPFLILQSDNRGLLAYDDDGGGGLNAAILFECPDDGFYSIVATVAFPPFTDKEPSGEKEKLRLEIEESGPLTMQRLQTILRGLNVKFTMKKTEAEVTLGPKLSAILNRQARGNVLTLGCNDFPAVSERIINEWNDHKALLNRAVLRAKFSRLEADLDCGQGITPSMVRRFLQRYTQDLQDFGKFIGNQQ